ncbi:hypothetical protein KFE96_12615 [Kordiimonas sp. SCSIO 12603]|uniref:hypothetical protein n=1 Tax=Kordiimonas sp. SCSIO 12603 TaxID=2829596 RepID=UPI002105C1A6|nr:hypothetical protein [Kordiimonas sp. SCSIO 12603]UTW57674.1 hypothetical protein KFE96_12615 [Kordiimonas sp. SCSIO 12603]
MRTIGKIAIASSLLFTAGTSLTASQDQDVLFDTTSFVLSESNRLAAERKAAKSECSASEEHLQERLVELTEQYTFNMQRIDSITSKIGDVQAVESVRNELVKAEMQLANIQKARMDTAYKLATLRQQSKSAVQEVRSDFDMAIMQQVEAALAIADAALRAAK